MLVLFRTNVQQFLLFPVFDWQIGGAVTYQHIDKQFGDLLSAAVPAVVRLKCETLAHHVANGIENGSEFLSSFAAFLL